MGSPLGLTITTDPANPAVRIKDSGFGSAATMTPASPDFGALPAAWLRVYDSVAAPDGWNPAAHPSPILAMSLGIDIFYGQQPAGSTYWVMEPDPGGWLTLEFAVIDAQVVAGAAGNATHIEDAKAAGDLNATVFSYLVDGSEVEGDPYGNQSVMALSSTDLELNPVDDIVGLNMHMALYETAAGLGEGSYFFTGGPLSSTPTVYFTVREDFLAQVADNQGWLKNWNNPERGAIYASSWDGTSWSDPTLFASWNQIVPAEAIAESIVGIAIGPVLGGTGLLFSTYDAPIEDQIRFRTLAGPDVGPLAVAFRELDDTLRPAGIKIGAGKGLGDFCTKDPLAFFTATRTPLTARPVIDDFSVARRGLAPHLFDPEPVSLAVSGFRALVDGHPGMRTCMNWPGKDRPDGTALVAWGLIRDYTGASTPGAVPRANLSMKPDDWVGFETVPFSGQPVTAERRFPDGLPEPIWKHALAAQWALVVEGRFYAGPLSILRLWEPVTSWWIPLPPQVARSISELLQRRIWFGR